jgi:hypothetical protein
VRDVAERAAHSQVVDVAHAEFLTLLDLLTHVDEYGRQLISGRHALMVCFVRTEARNLTVSGMASTQGRLRSLGNYAVTAARFEERGRSLN